MSTIKVTPETQQKIERYRKFAQEHEYTFKTTLGYSTYISRFLRQKPQVEKVTLREQISDFLEKQQECSPLVFKECRAALYLYYRMITGERFPKRQQIECNPDIEVMMKRFYDYSINIKRIKQSTAEKEARYIRKFLENTSAAMPQRIAEVITAHEIRDYIVDHLAHLSDSSKGTAVTAIRNYFRFQKFEGFPVHDSVFLLPLSPAVWRNAALPTTLDEDVFDDLDKVPNEDTPTGKRDRCIILCFTELALRCIEVASLTLDDFNWYESCVSIKNTKNHSDRKLPISEKLGKAIAGYLQAARPQTACRTLFVRFKHTCGEPMGRSQIRGVVRKVYEKSSTVIEANGTHILRRTAGSKLYNSGNSLKLIADILGHESLDSTARYAKTDIAGLRQVAAQWPDAAIKAGDHGVQ